MRAALLAASLTLVACAKSNAVVCGDVTCPPSSTCGANGECIPEGCGNGTVEGNEACDGDIGDQACSDFGYSAGTLSCSSVCQIDLSECFDRCGNHVVDIVELCDGTPPAGLGCADFGYDVGPLVCTPACSPAFNLCGHIGWQVAPGGGTNELRSVWLSAARIGFAVGLQGLILRSTDGVWTQVASPTTANLYGVSGTSEGVMAVGAGGTILRVAMGAWVPMTSPTQEDLFAITPTGLSTAIAVGDHGIILRFDGTSWSVLRAANPNAEALRAVWAGPALAFAAGDLGTLVRSVNGGAWTPVDIGAGTKNLTSVIAVDGEVFVGGEDRSLWRSNGVGWNLAVLPSDIEAVIDSDIDIRSLWASSKNDVFIGFEAGHIVHWNGTRFVRQTSASTRTIYSLYGLNAAMVVGATRGGSVIEYTGTDRRAKSLGPESLFGIQRDGSKFHVVGNLGTVWTWDTATDVWTSQPADPNGPVLSNTIWSAGADIFVGSINLIFRSQGGAAFTQVAAVGANSIWGVTSPSLYAISVGRRVAETTNGTQWTIVSPDPHGAGILYDVYRTEDNVWFAVGENGFAMKRIGQTGAWEPIPTDVDERLSAVWGLTSDNVYAVGTHGTIVHWDGTRWRRQHSGTGENLSTVHGTGTGDIYVGGSDSTLLHYDGIAWTPMTTDKDVYAIFATPGQTVTAGLLGTFTIVERALLGGEERCSDPWDDDGNGLTNCDDPACYAAGIDACRAGGACATLTRLTCAAGTLDGTSYSGLARIDDLPCIDHSTPGPEASYRFVAETSGSHTVTITETAAEPLLDLVVTPAAPATGGACDIEACQAATRSGTSQTVTFDAVAGQTYYVIVDGPVYQGADFTLTLGCP